MDSSDEPMEPMDSSDEEQTPHSDVEIYKKTLAPVLEQFQCCLCHNRMVAVATRKTDRQAVCVRCARSRPNEFETNMGWTKLCSVATQAEELINAWDRGASVPESAVATNSIASLRSELAQTRASCQLILKKQDEMREEMSEWFRKNQVVLPPCPTMMRGGVKLPEQRQEQAPYHEEDVEEIPVNVAAHDEPRQQPEQGEWGTQGQQLSEKLSDELSKFFETTHCIIHPYCFEDYETVRKLAALLKRAGLGVSSSDSPMGEVFEARQAQKRLIVAANADMEINDPGLVNHLSNTYGKCPVVDVRWFLTVLAARDLRVMRLHVISDTSDEDFARWGFPPSVYSLNVQKVSEANEPTS